MNNTNPYKSHFSKLKKNKTKFEIKKKSGSDQRSPMPIRRKRKSLPLSSIVGFVFLVGGAGYGYQNSERLEELLSKVEIQFFGSALAEEKKPETGKNSTQEVKKEEKIASEKSPEKKSESVNFQNMTQEELALFKSLEERKRQLDTRESNLKKLEEELHKQKVELDQKLSQLDQLRGQIGNQLQERVKTDEAQVDKLVQFYASMKPVKAAKIIETLNEDLAIEVLKKMKKKEAAEILNMIEPAKAQKLSERFAGYRK